MYGLTIQKSRQLVFKGTFVKVLQRTVVMAASSSTATSTRMEAATAQPTVVLLGWMGCQPRYLERYQRALYSHWHVLQRIATPAQVIRATLTLPTANPPRPPRTWPYHMDIDTESAESVEDVAWSLLAELDELGEYAAPVIFIHLFSNGGGFVWEAMARILEGASQSNDHTSADNSNGKESFPAPIRQRLCSIQRRLAGVVVDSAPSLQFDKLPAALQHVSWREQAQTWWSLLPLLLPYSGRNNRHNLLPQWLWWRSWNTPAVKDILQQRADAYRRVWVPPSSAREEMSPSFASVSTAAAIPMLFLYSANDSLASTDAIRDIVRERQSSNHATQTVCWQESVHCAHLVRHPREYTNAVQDFIQVQLTRPDGGVPRNLRSKL